MDQDLVVSPPSSSAVRNPNRAERRNAMRMFAPRAVRVNTFARQRVGKIR